MKNLNYIDIKKVVEGTFAFGTIQNYNEIYPAVEFLLNQIEVESAEELIDVINERSIGVDLDSDEVIELFDMIKSIKEVAN